MFSALISFPYFLTPYSSSPPSQYLLPNLNILCSDIKQLYICRLQLKSITWRKCRLGLVSARPRTSLESLILCQGSELSAEGDSNRWLCVSNSWEFEAGRDITYARDLTEAKWKFEQRYLHWDSILGPNSKQADLPCFQTVHGRGNKAATDSATNTCLILHPQTWGGG
jgi:hypothetical protein